MKPLLSKGRAAQGVKPKGGSHLVPFTPASQMLARAPLAPPVAVRSRPARRMATTVARAGKGEAIAVGAPLTGANALEALRSVSTLCLDSAELEAVQCHCPEEATTNPT